MIFQENFFSYYILLTDQISLSDYLETMGNMCIATVCFPGCDAISFEINIIVLIKPFWYMNINSRDKFKFLENEKSF